MAFDLKAFYSKIYLTYDLVNRLFTMGMDKKWRKYTAKRCIEQKPSQVLDLCCGTGDLSIDLCMADKDNLVEITGYDFNPDMLRVAEIKAKSKGLNSSKFVEGDAGNIPFGNDAFDAITIGFGFRNLTFDNPSKNKHIEEIHRVLSPGGELLILESGVPQNRIVRFFYKIYLFGVLVPLGTVISGNAKAYWYLAHSSSKFFTTNQVEAILKEKGFSRVEIKKFFFGAANLFIVTK